MDRLLEQLRLWHGGLHVEPGHFTGAGLGARQTQEAIEDWHYWVNRGYEF